MTDEREDGPAPDVGVALPEDPAAAMAALGVETHDEAVPADDGLEAVKRRIVQDLEARQGSFRGAGVVGRYWPFALSVVFVAFLVVMLKPAPAAGGLKLLASLGAGVAGLVCLFSAIAAPSRPALGERLATVGLLVAVAALVVEGVVGASMPHEHVDLGATCAATVLVCAALPLAGILLGLRRAGVPVRRRHAAGCAAAAVAMAGATVWIHCPADNLWHVMSGHMSIPALLAVGLSVGLFTLFAPKPLAR